MKLIDILVQELPKRGGWPVNAAYAKQSEADCEVYFYKESGRGVGNYFNPGVRADDCQFSSLEVVTKSDYEAALAASKLPVWDGEGLPPVGIECEYLSNNASWGRVKIIGYDGKDVVFRPSGDVYYSASPDEKCVFLPIRTEAERKREEAIKAIWAESEIRARDGGHGAAELVYQAIAAGKIPGIRLTDDPTE